jgi:hypothetical protein
MNIVPPGFHFRLQRDNTIDEGHDDLSAIRAASKETIGVDIDLQSHRVRQLHPAEPVPENALGRHLAAAFQQEAAAVAAAEDGQRRRRGS